MNEIKLYANRLPFFALALIALLCALGCVWWTQTHSDNTTLIQGIMLASGIICLIALFKIVRRPAKISLSIHGIQFHYPTERQDQTHTQNMLNQFIAWEDIHIIQTHKNILELHIDDNPPDYERLTDIELANLPPREITFYQLRAKVSGLNKSPNKVMDWVNQLQQAPSKERTSLILSFHYEK